MVVDASAVVAIIFREPEAERCERTLAAAVSPIMGAPSMLETLMVLSRKMGSNAEVVLREAIDAFGIEIVPFNRRHAKCAQEAFLQFGKGRHPAGLNFGDCMAYALAKEEGQPLLFIGNDFTRTDIPAA